MQKNKLFIAIDVPPDVQDEVERLQQLLKESHLIHARYPSRKQIHITLAFLAFVNANHIPKIKELLAHITWQLFTISLCGINYFVRHEQITVIYLSLHSEELLALANTIQNDLRQHNFYTDTQLYVPHITLARVLKTPRSDQLKDFLKTCAIKSCAFDVSQISLKESCQDNTLVHKIIFNVSSTS